MPRVTNELMQKLYGSDIWDGFTPIAMPDEVQGWNGHVPSLSRLAATPGSKVVIDVGVWKGQSTINMAKSLKDNSIDGCVLAVDTYLGSIENWTQNLFERYNGRPNLFEQFMSNVVSAGVQDFVVPIALTSISAVAILRRYEITASLIHIDAAHEYEEVLRDATEYWERLERGGTMIGDDYVHGWPGVVRAAGEFSASLRLPLEVEMPKWIIRKP